jgi:anti-sigma-K factor RskA
MSESMIGGADTDTLAAEYVLGTLDFDERAAALDLLSKDQGFAAKVKTWERRLGELHLMVEPVEPEPDIWQRIKAKLPEVKRDPVLTLPQIKPEAALEAEYPVLKLTPEAKTGPANIAAGSVALGRAEPAAAPDVAALPSWLPARVQAQLEATASAAVKSALDGSDAPSPPFDVVPGARADPASDRDERLSLIQRHLVRWRTVAVLMTLAVLAVAALLALWKYEPERVPPVLRPLALMRLVGISINTSSTMRERAPPESQFDE